MSEIALPALPELRHAVVPFRDIEFRDASATGDGSYTLTGYAAVFDEETVLFDLGWYRLREVIQAGAFTNVLATKPDVHLNIGHDMNRAIARTLVDGIGGLELTQDKKGLRVFSRLDPADPDVVALAAKMNRGIVDQMSFAFTIAKAERLIEEDEENDETDVLRTIIEIGQLYDVCVCAQGAYPQTSTELAMRSLAQVLGRAGVLPAGQEEHRVGGAEPPAGAVEPVAPTPEERGAELEEPAVVEPEAEEGGVNPRSRAAASQRMRMLIDE